MVGLSFDQAVINSQKGGKFHFHFPTGALFFNTTIVFRFKSPGESMVLTSEAVVAEDATSTPHKILKARSDLL